MSFPQSAPSSESYFAKIANDVLDATEKLSMRMEDGLAALFSKSPFSTNEKSSPVASDSADTFAYETEDGGFPQDSMTPGEANDDAFDDEDFVRSPLDGIANDVLSDIMKNQARPQTLVDHFQAFRHAIRWKEPFILSLLLFHIFMFAFCIWVSRSDRTLAPRLFAMILIAVIVKSAERINEYGALHWEEFATQNYFDERGVFFSIMVSAPLLLDSLIMMLMFLKEASQLLIQVKSSELIKKKKAQNKQKQKKSKTTESSRNQEDVSSSAGANPRRAKKDQ